MKVFIVLCTVALAYAANPACRLEPETGLCRGYFPRYYYDPEDGSCKKFIYGGCGGNANSFDTEEECLEECAGTAPEGQSSVQSLATCHQKPERGLCLAYMPRYYYNAETRKCEKFIYGGCGGNSNNFNTLEECRTRCVESEITFSEVSICELPAESGPCLAYMPRYYYDKTEGKCKKFVYGGCQGNENNFKTLEECQKQCGVSYYQSTCQQKPETGMCRGYFPRYYYDEEEKECKRFVYGGCGGNDNNFETREDCETTCKVQESRSKSVCLQEKVVGPCKAAFHRFYFNKDSGKCEGFIYGGCQGNENNFVTLEDCQNTCEATVALSEPDCISQPEIGFCEGYFRRYFYDQSTGTCEVLIYTGCGGNGNNYRTLDECLRICA